MSHGHDLASRCGCTPLRNGYGLLTIDTRRLYSPHTRPTPQSLERILYVWAIRHPASGYVQGINDLATPFFQVFLSAYVGKVTRREFHIHNGVSNMRALPVQMQIPKK